MKYAPKLNAVFCIKTSNGHRHPIIIKCIPFAYQVNFCTFNYLSWYQNKTVSEIFARISALLTLLYFFGFMTRETNVMLNHLTILVHYQVNHTINDVNKYDKIHIKRDNKPVVTMTYWNNIPRIITMSTIIFSTTNNTNN